MSVFIASISHTKARSFSRALIMAPFERFYNEILKFNPRDI